MASETGDTTMKSRLLKEYRDICRSMGVEIVGYGATGGGHVWLECRRGSVTRKIFLASTPGDHRAMLNMRTDIRRAFGLYRKEKAPQLQSGGAKWA
jgi:hypothetical protein